ncbi:MAG: hypothetical protein HYZ37_01135 [Candidatus Solibacter usitatus]|nr:hypothetical protein [Candidatus Solibacter usitatus]
MKLSWLLLLVAEAAWAQLAPKPEVVLLSRIKVRASENLSRLPNFTCIETIERSVRKSPGRRYELVDLLRLEVGVVSGKEVFAWPGSKNFDDRDIVEIVNGGMIGNGSFSGFARAVFLTNGPTFQYRGPAVLNGVKTEKFDYAVPAMVSGYTLTVRPAKGIVGYHGSFWADAEKMDVVRLELVFDYIPPGLPIAAGFDKLDFSTVRIGETDYVVPKEAEMSLTDFAGSENRNHLRFTNCKEFRGESVIRFDDAPGGENAANVAPVEITLPEELDVELRLEDEIVGGVSAIGDAIRARVATDVKRKGQVILPRGAIVTGRIRALERVHGRQDTYWIVGLHFFRVEFGNKFGTFHGKMYPVTSPSTTSTPLRSDTLRLAGILYMRGEKGKLPAGLRTSWHTIAPPTEVKP